MATWNDVKELLSNKYPHKETDEGIILLQKFTNGRQQMICVFPKDVKGAVWVDISSVIGTIKPEDLDAALEEVAGCYAGGLIKVDDLYGVRHCMPIADLSLEEILDPLLVIASVADLLESKFIGEDTF